MALSIAQPLGVGVYSSGEYMDLILVEEMDVQEIIDRLNAKSASGIKFMTAIKFHQLSQMRKRCHKLWL